MSTETQVFELTRKAKSASSPTYKWFYCEVTEGGIACGPTWYFRTRKAAAALGAVIGHTHIVGRRYERS